MKGYLPFGFLWVFSLFVFGLGDLAGSGTAIHAESAAASSTLTLRFYPLDLEAILTIVAVSLWGLILLIVVLAILYALVRCCCSLRNEATPEGGDDTKHLTSLRHSTEGKNEISTYYVYLNPEDVPNTEPSTPENGNRMSSTVDISIQTYGAI